MSTLKADTIQSTSGGAATLTKQSAAKAWLNHTQVSTHAIQGSFNISSITDAGTGYTNPISFTNNMSDANYAGSMYQSGDTNTTYNNFSNNYVGGLGTKTTSSFGVSSYAVSALTDVARNDSIIQGDLA